MFIDLCNHQVHYNSWRKLSECVELRLSDCQTLSSNVAPSFPSTSTPARSNLCRRFDKGVHTATTILYHVTRGVIGDFSVRPSCRGIGRHRGLKSVFESIPRSVATYVTSPLAKVCAKYGS